MENNFEPTHPSSSGPLKPAAVLAPTQQTERIRSLDVLRGFALLGILIVNIQSFAMIGAAYQFPTSYGDFTGANYWAWWFTHVFFDSKMMAIFSMLFGAGIVLMSERAIKKTGKVAWLHTRRMFWLLVFGLAHAHLLWFGDILFSYALCGMLVFWIRNWRPRWLIAIGLCMLAVSSAFFIFSSYAIPTLPEEQLAAFRSEWTPDEAKVQTEIEIYRGSWIDQMRLRVPTAIMFETFLFGIYTLWRSGGLMLIGMAFFKLGIFSAQRSKIFYWAGAIIGLSIGLASVLAGVRSSQLADWEPIHLMFTSSQFNYWGSLLVSFGYVCLIMLLCKSDMLGWLKRSWQAVGQMALTNYLLQTIVCTTIFYGHGFGLFGMLERYQQIGVVLIIWIAQMIWSPIWLIHFRYGPFEWAWRSLAYWKIQPMQLEPNQFVRQSG